MTKEKIPDSKLFSKACERVTKDGDRSPDAARVEAQITRIKCIRLLNDSSYSNDADAALKWLEAYVAGKTLKQCNRAAWAVRYYSQPRPKRKKKVMP